MKEIDVEQQPLTLLEILEKISIELARLAVVAESRGEFDTARRIKAARASVEKQLRSVDAE